MITLEVCVDDPAGMMAAVRGGADRIELCAALALGGLTPSAGLMRVAADLPLPVMAMIRPRAGNFIWSEAEISAQLAEIAAARACGLAGVVIGASLPDGRLDAETLARLVAAAQGLDLTLHRAIDLAPDPVAAMGVCRDLGILRVLSSGGAATACDGMARLAAMQAAAPDVTVMPGGGVSAATIAALARNVPLTQVHASCSTPAPPPADPRIAGLGLQPANARVTDAALVRGLRTALDQLAGSTTRG
ncbi:copper homeostasis protein CutC [Halodurantibacterium flavum]|uniref:PF03932 family protein CutC n=1 Tax=Halodurantibacterium flavum TaxID=1382802 RepID=A0ABW4S242_9RHOB